MPVINPTPQTAPSAGSDITGPCSPWPVTWTCDVDTLNPAVTGLAVLMATEALWSLTGMRFGLCEVTLRPCARECDVDGRFVDDFGPAWTSSYYPQPALINGLWFNLTCGRCTTGCSCTTVSEVILPAPVNTIVQVLIDGSPMVTGSYRLDDNRLLVRTDGDVWPRCNDLNKDDTEVGTWSITATYGEALPDGASLAVGQLACEIARSAGGEDCKLPAGIQQLVRQGVTISYADIGELFRQGRTGLYLVDMFVATWNPYGLRRRSGVYSVDHPPHRRAGT